ncbi:hypothetical protein IAR55_006669 [Kwoniella newhampshirensis]|uniref:Uncharacterized protein n=1 Tax=Kwoniella newhampshirensis TaxID=1651941 RepID=A0AAW0YET6_9TREE
MVGRRRFNDFITTLSSHAISADPSRMVEMVNELTIPSDIRSTLQNNTISDKPYSCACDSCSTSERPPPFDAHQKVFALINQSSSDRTTTFYHPDHFLARQSAASLSQVRAEQRDGETSKLSLIVGALDSERGFVPAVLLPYERESDESALLDRLEPRLRQFVSVGAATARTVMAYRLGNPDSMQPCGSNQSMVHGSSEPRRRSREAQVPDDSAERRELRPHRVRGRRRRREGSEDEDSQSPTAGRDSSARSRTGGADWLTEDMAEAIKQRLRESD